ncbi:MAG: hypothetical protein KJN77_06600 [Gammaproteobacteria bacterium]|nr:hypothetical protein [Gammaproteobacteria bacterium]
MSAALLALGLAVGFGPPSAWAFAQGEEADPDPGSSAALNPRKNMDETVRASVRKVVVLPTPSPYPPDKAVTGSYRDETPGLIEGGIKGSEIGKGVGTEIGGISIGIPFPILTLPGAIIGGISGETKEQIQKFRDRMTEDLRDSANHPLTNDALATNVFWGLKRLPSLEPKVLSLSAPVPGDTDAILYVSVTDLAIDVQGEDAIVTTSAGATLRRPSDGTDLYYANVQYQDRDSLSNWTKNDSALWRTYSNFARQYIGREISEEVFGRIALTHELRPRASDTVKLVKRNAWQGESKSKTPTLAWSLDLAGGDAHAPWADQIDEADIFYDIEIYNENRPVYTAKRLADPSHVISQPLEPCKTYRWSVRPAYQVGNDVKFGDWMRKDAGLQTQSGKVGIAASVAPAYTYDFASLKVHCKAR